MRGGYVVPVRGDEGLGTAIQLAAAHVRGAVTVVTTTLDGQGLSEEVQNAAKVFGMHHVNIDIGDAVNSILDGLENATLAAPADLRLALAERMSALAAYAVAEAVGGSVFGPKV